MRKRTVRCHRASWIRWFGTGICISALLLQTTGCLSKVDLCRSHPRKSNSDDWSDDLGWFLLSWVTALSEAGELRQLTEDEMRAMVGTSINIESLFSCPTGPESSPPHCAFLAVEMAFSGPIVTERQVYRFDDDTDALECAKYEQFDVDEVRKFMRKPRLPLSFVFYFLPYESDESVIAMQLTISKNIDQTKIFDVKCDGVAEMPKSAFDTIEMKDFK